MAELGPVQKSSYSGSSWILVVQRKMAKSECAVPRCLHLPEKPVHLQFGVRQDPHATNIRQITSQSFHFLLHKVGLIIPALTISQGSDETSGRRGCIWNIRLYSKARYRRGLSDNATQASPTSLYHMVINSSILTIMKTFLKLCMFSPHVTACILK